MNTVNCPRGEQYFMICIEMHVFSTEHRENVKSSNRSCDRGFEREFNISKR